MDVEAAARPFDDLVDGFFTGLFALNGVDNLTIGEVDDTFTAAVYDSDAAGVLVMTFELDDVSEGEPGY